MASKSMMAPAGQMSRSGSATTVSCDRVQESCALCNCYAAAAAVGLGPCTTSCCGRFVSRGAPTRAARPAEATAPAKHKACPPSTLQIARWRSSGVQSGVRACMCVSTATSPTLARARMYWRTTSGQSQTTMRCGVCLCGSGSGSGSGCARVLVLVLVSVWETVLHVRAVCNETSPWPSITGRLDLQQNVSVHRSETALSGSSQRQPLNAALTLPSSCCTDSSLPPPAPCRSPTTTCKPSTNTCTSQKAAAQARPCIRSRPAPTAHHPLLLPGTERRCRSLATTLTTAPLLWIQNSCMS